MTFDGPSRRVLCEPLDLHTDKAPGWDVAQTEPHPAPAERRPSHTTRASSDE